MAISADELRLALERPTFGRAFAKAVVAGLALLDALQRKLDHPTLAATLRARIAVYRARRAATAALGAYSASIGRRLNGQEQAVLRTIIADEASRQKLRRMLDEADRETTAFRFELARSLGIKAG